MLKDLKIVHELQKIDLEMDALKRNKAGFPKQIESLTIQLQEEQGKVANQKKSFQSLEEKKRSLDMDLRDKEEKIKKSEERLMAVKSNAEYKAMQKEIEMAKKETAVLEDQILDLLLQIDTSKQKLVDVEKEVAEGSKKIEEEISHIKDDFSHIDGSLSEKEVARKEKVRELKEDTLSVYDRIRTQVDLAVTEIQKGKCSGCDMAIPPQLLNDICKGDSLQLCPNCNRILTYTKD